MSYTSPQDSSRRFWLWLTSACDKILWATRPYLPTGSRRSGRWLKTVLHGISVITSLFGIGFTAWVSFASWIESTPLERHGDGRSAKTSQRTLGKRSRGCLGSVCRPAILGMGLLVMEERRYIIPCIKLPQKITRLVALSPLFDLLHDGKEALLQLMSLEGNVSPGTLLPRLPHSEGAA